MLAGVLSANVTCAIVLLASRVCRKSPIIAMGIIPLL